ncbi:unnamed protein product [Euphydryas editha]|uniref:Uncharacterized protein n=1 Tax=Euphydryas editha TaxID=104508 RepID=A0AAU9TNW9_EUPED|nr:unnamed protein product [Euphydryas editha]
MLKINVFVIFILMNVSSSSYFYKLDKDLYSSFSLDFETDVCDNFNDWILFNGDTSGDSAYYISPSDVTSCIAFSFYSSPSGFVEIKQIFFSTSLKDRITITVYAEKITEDTVIGKANISSSDKDFFNGSQIITIPTKSYSEKGYITLIGEADKKSKMKIHSIKYIPEAFKTFDIKSIRKSPFKTKKSPTPLMYNEKLARNETSRQSYQNFFSFFKSIKIKKAKSESRETSRYKYTCYYKTKPSSLSIPRSKLLRILNSPKGLTMSGIPTNTVLATKKYTPAYTTFQEQTEFLTKEIVEITPAQSTTKRTSNQFATEMTFTSEIPIIPEMTLWSSSIPTIISSTIYDTVPTTSDTVTIPVSTITPFDLLTSIPVTASVPTTIAPDTETTSKTVSTPSTETTPTITTEIISTSVPTTIITNTEDLESTTSLSTTETTGITSSHPTATLSTTTILVSEMTSTSEITTTPETTSWPSSPPTTVSSTTYDTTPMTSETVTIPVSTTTLSDLPTSIPVTTTAPTTITPDTESTSETISSPSTETTPTITTETITTPVPTTIITNTEGPDSTTSLSTIETTEMTYSQSTTTLSTTTTLVPETTSTSEITSSPDISSWPSSFPTTISSTIYDTALTTSETETIPVSTMTPPDLPTSLPVTTPMPTSITPDTESTSVTVSTTEVVTEIPEMEDIFNFWQPLTIALVAFPSVLVLGLVALGIYKFCFSNKFNSTGFEGVVK